MGIPLSPPENEVVAVILCAGKGTRLGELTKSFPKPLISIEALDRITILEDLIHKLENLGIQNILVIVGYESAKVKTLIERLKRSHEEIGEKVNVIDAKSHFEKGPLYSFLAFTRNSRFFTQNNTYLVMPGDTFFEWEFLTQVVEKVKECKKNLEKTLFLFYRLIKRDDLNEILEEKAISIIGEKKGPEGTSLMIKKFEPGKKPPENGIRQVLPLFLFSHAQVKTIIRLEKKESITTIKKAVNLMIFEGQNLELVELKGRHGFFDIDYLADLEKLNFLIEQGKIER